jgi:hypothetical protein
MKLPVFCFIFFAAGIFRCAAQEEKSVHRYFNSFEDSALNISWMNSNTIISGNDSAKNHFSRTDKTSPYSAGLEIEIPADLKGKNFRILIQGMVRTTIAGANNQLVISVARNDSSIFWYGEHLADSTGKINDWNMFLFSFLMPANIPGDAKVKIFVWNSDGKAETDVDNLDISFTAAGFPTFLPQ